MPRIRTVKPELFRHEALFEGECAYKLPLRLAFIGLFTCCDREGRFRWRPKQLKLDVFPYDDMDMEEVLNALVKSGFVVKYSHHTETYGCIPSWKKHQQINVREVLSVIPEFEENNIFIGEGADDLSHQSECSLIDVTDKKMPQPTDEKNHHTTEQPVRTDPILKNDQKKNTTALVLTSSSANKAVAEIFEQWKKVMGSANAKLDNKRTSTIQNALEIGYTITQLFEAIEGCRNTPHNMGANEQGQRYDGLHIIFRDADQIDRFIHNFHQPPRQLNDAEKRTKSNAQTMQNWLHKKLNQEEE